MLRRLIVCAVLVRALAPSSAQTMLTNPLLSSGPDPWVVVRNGFYYFLCSTQNSLIIRKTRHLAQLAEVVPHVIWTPPASGPYSHDIWAPELHFIRGKWYVYFAADAGTNITHRIYVIENASVDPTEGTWMFKGKVTDRTDKWAIDPTVFESSGRLYMAWSGWAGDTNGRQDIYLAELANPWTVKSERVRIGTPEFPWEHIGDRDIPRVNGNYPPADPVEPTHVDVNEAPEVLQHDGRLFLVYSANGCWTDFYSLAMLEATPGGDLLEPRTWKKHPQPVFTYAPEAHAWAPGHNGFFQSPDGRESWIVYHANPERGQGCGEHRSPRAQRFNWNADGTPNFGQPVTVGKPVDSPSGEAK